MNVASDLPTFDFEAIRSAIAALPGYGSCIERQAIPTGEGRWLVMAGAGTGGELVAKLVHVNDRPSREIATVSGQIVVIRPHGAIATLDAEALTIARTAALAALATDRLARADASVMTVFGTGSLARPHVEAIGQVRSLSEIRIVGRTFASAKSLANRLCEDGWPARAVDVRGALEGVAIVTTVTTSRVPVFRAAEVPKGAHINAMGSFLPNAREIPAETVGRARIVVDAPATIGVGDISLALEEGALDDVMRIAVLLDHERSTTMRTDDEEITLFKSSGHIVFDLAAISTLQFPSRQQVR